MKELLLILAVTGSCSAADLKIGTPAPPLTFNQLLQAPAEASVSWQSLKGNAVVLEFWATWCASCRDQISHLNRLEERFRNKPVRFISLTDEEPSIVRRFLKDYPISGWIGLDSNEQTFKRYGVLGRPETVLVDAVGIVRGIGNASNLTGETIESLLGGKPIVFSMEGVSVAKLQALPDPLYQVMIRSAGPVDVTGFSPGAISGKAGKRWETWGVGLLRLLSEAYSIPEKRIEAPAWTTPEGRGRFDVAVATPDLTNSQRLELLQRGIEATFRLKAHRESRKTNVYVLQRRHGVETKLRPAASGAASHWGKNGNVTAVSMPTAKLLSIAEQTLGATVVDETGLTGRFDFELTWDMSNPQTIVEAFRTQLGLELIQSRRPLEFLVVDSAVQPQSW